MLENVLVSCGAHSSVYLLLIAIIGCIRRTGYQTGNMAVCWFYPVATQGTVPKKTPMSPKKHFSIKNTIQTKHISINCDPDHDFIASVSILDLTFRVKNDQGQKINKRRIYSFRLFLSPFSLTAVSVSDLLQSHSDWTDGWCDLRRHYGKCLEVIFPTTCSPSVGTNESGKHSTVFIPDEHIDPLWASIIDGKHWCHILSVEN